MICFFFFCSLSLSPVINLHNIFKMKRKQTKERKYSVVTTHFFYIFRTSADMFIQSAKGPESPGSIQWTRTRMSNIAMEWRIKNDAKTTMLYLSVFALLPTIKFMILLFTLLKAQRIPLHLRRAIQIRAMDFSFNENKRKHETVAISTTRN